MRAMYPFMAATLVISLILIATPTQRLSANPSHGLSEWDRIPTPTTKDWTLAPDSAIIDYALASNGEVAYVIVDKDGESCHLLKSTDSAATWIDITNGVNDEIERKGLGNPEDLVFVKVATDGENPDVVAVALNITAGSTHVFISNDGGSNFKDTGEVDLDEVFELAVSPQDADGWRDLAIGGIGGLFRCQTIMGLSTTWEDTTAYDGWDNDGAFTSTAVVAIEFAPLATWAVEKTILAVTCTGYDDIGDVYLQSGSWSETEGWNHNAGFPEAVRVVKDVFIPDLGALTAGIALPLDYSGKKADTRYAWVWVNYKDADAPIGKIFQVTNTTKAITEQISGLPWLTNVCYLGYIASGKAITGVLSDGKGGPTDCCAGVPVYLNTGVTRMEVAAPSSWQEASKPPTGRLAMAAFYASNSKAYAVALGAYDPYDEGAWSVSWEDNTTDIGDVWNQLSLIDTKIDYLSDVAVSPDCNKMWLVSINEPGEETEQSCYCDSVWLKAVDLPEAPEYSGQWLRTWSGQLDWGMLRLPPDGITGNLTADEIAGETVYLVDYDTNTVYWNTVETLACWEQCTAVKLSGIVDLAVKDKSTVYALASNGMVAMADEYGCNWHARVDSKVNNGWTIAVRGDDMLVGGQYGGVAYSSDGGKNFTELENVPISGLVTVAFDTYFDANNTTYAAVAAGGNRGAIYRWVIGQSTEWQALGAEPYAYTGLVLDNADGNPMTSKNTGGVLYASYVSGNTTGVARCLTPAAEISCEKCIEWDYLEVGLSGEESFQAMPQALKNCGSLTLDSNTRLLAIDSNQEYDMEDGETGAVWTLEDCYAKAAPSLTAPTKGFLVPADACNCSNIPFSLRWQRVCDARAYDIQIALDRNFNDIMEDIAAYEAPIPTAPAYLVAKGELLPGVTYYWRVRAMEGESGQIIHSWWSTSLSFTVALGPVDGPELAAPQEGATDVAVTKVAFTWSALTLADKYDWVLSKNADLSNPIDTKLGLTTTALTYTGTLDYSTTYYWRVTAWKEGIQISQSNTGSFRTRARTSLPVVPRPVTPPWVWVIIAIGAVLVIVVVVLMFRTRRI